MEYKNARLKLNHAVFWTPPTKLAMLDSDITSLHILLRTIPRIHFVLYSCKRDRLLRYATRLNCSFFRTCFFWKLRPLRSGRDAGKQQKMPKFEADISLKLVRTRNHFFNDRFCTMFAFFSDVWGMGDGRWADGSSKDGLLMPYISSNFNFSS